jgi:hypothetical protein
MEVDNLDQIYVYNFEHYYADQMCEKVCCVNLYKRDLSENRAAATVYCHNGI